METVTTGGSLTSSGTVANPDQIVQHVEKSASAVSGWTLEMEFASTPTYHEDQDANIGGTAEYWITFTPANGVTVVVTDYDVNESVQFNNWHDIDGSFSGIIAQEAVLTGGIELTGPNEIRTWWDEQYYDTWQTPGNPPTTSVDQSGTGEEDWSVGLGGTP